MQITKQSTSHINVDNLRKLITEILDREGYRVDSISFDIPTHDRRSKVKYQATYGSTPATFYGAIVKAREVNAKSQSRSLVKVNDVIDVKITEDELLTLAKEHLVSEGYQIVENPEIAFTTEYDDDGPFSGCRDVFDGIKCLTNKEVKTIRIGEN